MSRRLATGVAAAVLVGGLSAQDPLAGLKSHLDARNPDAALSAFSTLLRDPASRSAAGEAEGLLAEAGLGDRAGSTLEAAVLGGAANDPVLLYVWGVSLRRQRRLGEADDVLRRAVAVDDVSGIPRTLWAWNAVQRFDPDSARLRAASLRNDEAPKILAAADAMTSPSRLRARLLGIAAALGVGALALWAVGVFKRSRTANP